MTVTKLDGGSNPSGRIPMTGAQRQARYRRRHPERIARSNRTRVWVGRYYVGMTRTPETASVINDYARKEIHDRQDQS